MKPITPAEADKGKRPDIPDFVIEAFNQCIYAHWTGSRAELGQNEVIAKILATTLRPKEGISPIWLNIETLYLDYGWDVSVDKPYGDENYEITYTFRRR